MIAYMVIMIGVLAIIATAGYGVFTLLQSTERLAQASRNAARMEQVAIAVRSSLRSAASDGYLNAPSPEFFEGRPVVPSWLGSDSATPWGVRYGYCAYGALPAVGGDGTTQGFASASVDVDLGAYGVKPFVVRSAEPTGGRLIRALIVSPVLGQDSVPSCNDVTYSDGAFRVSGGTVQAVYESYSLATLLGGPFGSSAQMATVYVSNAASPGGNGTGASATNPMSLSAAMGLWKSGFYRDMVMDFAVTGVPYDLTGAYGSFDVPQFDAGRRVVLASRGAAPSARPQIRVASGGGFGGNLAFGSDVVIKDVDVPEGYLVLSKGARGRVEGSSLAGIALDGATASLSGVSVSQLLEAHGSKVTIAGSSVAAIAARASSTINLDTSDSGQIVVRDSVLDLGRGTQVSPSAGSPGVQAFGSKVSVSVGPSCAEGPVSVSRAGAAAAFDLYGSDLSFGGRDVAVVEAAVGQLYALDSSSTVRVSPRACGGVAVTPARLSGASFAACQSGAGGSCASLGAIPQDVGPRTTAVTADLACNGSGSTSGGICAVTATCPVGKVVSGGCDFAVGSGAAPILRRFKATSSSAFACEYARPDAVSTSTVTAVAQCSP